MSGLPKAIIVDAERPEIRGQIRQITERSAPWDEQQQLPVWVLRGPNGGERAQAGVPAVLRRHMLEADAMIGEDVIVRYVGTGQTSAVRDFVIHELDFPEREAA